MAIEGLTVKLNNGSVLYFEAGAIVGDVSSRLDLLREAIDNDSTFRSPDVNGQMREFKGSEVATYFLD